MPSRIKKVRFETEYNSSFKAFNPDVYRSPLIEALLTESSTNELPSKNGKVAGLESQKFLKSTEPPLQHKHPLSKGTVHEKWSKNSPPKEKITNNISDSKNTKTSNKTMNNERNRALEFKVGLKPESLLEARTHPVSEYRRQYEWKRPVDDESPLLNAEKVVFDSHTNIPRFVRDKIPHRTEYQSRFSTDKTKRMHKRREKTGEEKEKEDFPSSSVKRLLQTSQNPDVPFFPHGSSSVYHTEYQANFGSPKKYKYEEGIWVGAKPPHLLPDDESTRDSTESLTNWFEEVLELREKARHYKIRALEGNYFSRDFLAKLDAELEELYGEHSDSDDSRNNKKSKRGGEDGKPSAVPLSRTIKQAWKSDTSDSGGDEDTNKDNLDKQNKTISSDSGSLSSCSEPDSVKSDPTPWRNQVETTKPRFGRTFAKKASNVGAIPKTSKRDLPTMLENTSGSDASSERSDGFSENNCSKSGTNSVGNGHLKTHFPQEKNGHVDPDRFNINTIQDMRSNDIEVLSTSVQSNFGSNSDISRKNEYDSQSDCMSHSSFASRESLARDTLSHAKQRKAQFWKK